MRLASIGPDGVRSWTMSALDVTGLPSDALYVYARCQRTGAGGVFVVDSEQRIFDSDPTFYYFLIGTLSSVDADGNTRVLSLTYGSTTVNGRYVRTGRIESVDGGTYFDLDAGEIGGNIRFNADSAATKSVIDSIVSGNDTVKAAANAASEAKDSLSVGGRNYFLESRGDSSAKIVLFQGSTLTTDEGVPCIRAKADTDCSGFYIYTDIMSSLIPTDKKVTWTCSVEVKSVGGGTVRLLWGAEGKSTTTTGIKGDAWQRITLTRTSTVGTFIFYKPYYQNIDTADSYLLLRRWQLELGSVATTWKPAPEDTDYLRSALTEATQAQTIVSGGLTLGSMIAVGSSGNALRAGLMGTEQAGGGVLPMVWAGSSAATSDGIRSCFEMIK